MLNQTLMNDAQVREDVLREMRLDSRLKGYAPGVEKVNDQLSIDPYF